VDVEKALNILCGVDPKFSCFAGLTADGLFSPLMDVQLTTTGIAVANANIRRKVGLEFDLGQWIK
jgi:hypothetical protein